MLQHEEQQKKDGEEPEEKEKQKNLRLVRDNFLGADDFHGANGDDALWSVSAVQQSSLTHLANTLEALQISFVASQKVIHPFLKRILWDKVKTM